ncbi:DUF397 domain-containing protein [Actinosynnema sp. CA-248983]
MNTKKTWRRSSYSGAANNCVELAVGPTAAVVVRDSKKPGLELTFPDGPFRAFLSTLRKS